MFQVSESVARLGDPSALHRNFYLHRVSRIQAMGFDMQELLQVRRPATLWIRSHNIHRHQRPTMVILGLYLLALLTN